MSGERTSRVTRRKFLKTNGLGLLTAGLAGCTQSWGNSEEFPSEKIEMIVPWSAGGGTDRTGRKLAELAGNEMDTSFYVTNKTGGSGSVGFNAIANAKPDGYTVGVTTVEICTISHLGIADVSPNGLKPVMQYNFDPASLTVPEKAPYDSLDGFVKYAKKNPGKIRISNSGTGAIWHLSAAGFAQQAGIDVKHAGYDGGSPATKAVLNGEVEATTASAAEVASQVKDGPLKILSVFGNERVSIFPNVPTLKEQGYDFTMGAWRGLTVPNETPDDRIKQLHDTYKSVYDSKTFESFMKQNGFGLVYRDTETFGSFMNEEHERFGNIIERLNLGN
ncbi:Bug family tripartite tricarboxylate transporter substrate binding protein [Haladaptatus caseinilyticus]|uniref:Bug family tripartite tricarboxylate transporter substrate binding protein n=1 Tax=Haladaptatus caseinilyticus TaxID=2993314 RepID=UPI00224AC382|nr:tripartite tricarboxylate transporter substrate binding protein [Haladaptatus caseinilyticus]